MDGFDSHLDFILFEKRDDKRCIILGNYVLTHTSDMQLEIQPISEFTF